MKIQTFAWPLPACIEALTSSGMTYCIETPEDYAHPDLPESVRTFFANRVLTQDDPDAILREQFAESAEAIKEAEFAAFKARNGAPSYRAAAVKIAAEKLGVLDAIDVAIMDLVNQASDKSLYVWWSETPTISRGDAEWQQIEPAVAWGKGVSADDLFALAAQI